ncbi:hypothetical protein EMPS_09226 [Entomortierella parvispora]|uniref:Uncharacterized protein n=1 Tax=Entomortierella parvispora TaxID=205924 RepID=A0A9P3M071_9FUNG|nr:hypothetical protein EMPS_09226 [Entomortierella parvispora]
MAHQQYNNRASPYRTSRSNSTSNSRTLTDTFSSPFSDGSHILRRSVNIARDISNLAAIAAYSSQPRVRHRNMTTLGNSRQNNSPSFSPTDNNQRTHQDEVTHYSLNSTNLHEARRVTATRTPNQMHHIQNQFPSVIRQGLAMPLHRGHQQSLDSESDDESADEDMNDVREHEMNTMLTDDRTSSNVVREPWQTSQRDRQTQLLQQRSRHAQEHQFSAFPPSQSLLQSDPSVSVQQNTQYGHQRPHSRSPQQQLERPSAEVQRQSPEEHVQRPAFLSQPVYQLACRACVRPLCLRAMKAVMLSDHSKELYSTDMPPSGLSLVNEDRQVRHCACRIRDSACLGCGQVAGYHVTQPCSSCLRDQNNGHFWMFYSSAVHHYKRNHIKGSLGEAMIWANVPPINHDQALARQLRLEVPILHIRTATSSANAWGDNNGAAATNERPLTACVEMEEWLNSPVLEIVCR